jgi:hypothetical protein
MDAAQCRREGGVPHAGICSPASDRQCCKTRPAAGAVVPSKPTNTMLVGLADILRGAGLTVVEVTGWKTRGLSLMVSVKGIIVHHTSGRAQGDFPSLRTVRDGHGDLSGPLSQLGLGRTGTWYVIAAGRANHAGKTIDDSLFGNGNAIGIEAESTGVPVSDIGHAHWPEVQYQSYIRGIKALQAAYGIPTTRVRGHKEVAIPAGRKTDPNFSMVEFRAALVSTRNHAAYAVFFT